MFYTFEKGPGCHSVRPTFPLPFAYWPGDTYTYTHKHIFHANQTGPRPVHPQRAAAHVRTEPQGQDCSSTVARVQVGGEHELREKEGEGCTDNNTGQCE